MSDKNDKKDSLDHIAKYELAPVPKCDALPANLESVARALVPSIPDGMSDVDIFRLYGSFAENVKAQWQCFLKLLKAATEFSGFETFSRYEEPFIHFLGAETAALPRDDMLLTVKQTMITTANVFMEWALTCLRHNALERRIGAIQSHNDRVCRFIFFNQRKDRRMTHEDANNRYYQEDTIDAIHVHDVINANRLEATKCFGLPPRVQNVVDKIPGFMSPVIDIVAGDKIAEIKAEAIVSRTTWAAAKPQPVQRVSYDPCLVMGPYVLCGWDDETPVRLRTPSEAKNAIAQNDPEREFLRTPIQNDGRRWSSRYGWAMTLDEFRNNLRLEDQQRGKGIPFPKPSGKHKPNADNSW